ncbi:MAG: hypothetical protein QM541_02170 [Flavobacterium sp.]|nr:hypothetical protein [Flavobacterium sp.]
MKISAFTYVRNGFTYGYPFLEAIQSILPICDECVVAVGDSNDGTREALVALHPTKMKIIDTVWDLELKKEGKIFAQQANIALEAISGDWAFHIQADEVIHENDIYKIKQAIEREANNMSVDGFILPFLHFWGDYKYVRNSRAVHNYEIRVFRNDKFIRSYGDSQGFRIYTNNDNYRLEKEKGKKLKVKKIDAPIYHYNGVRSDDQMKRKVATFVSFYHKDVDTNDPIFNTFSFQQVDRVKLFIGTHPSIMQDKIEAHKSDFIFNPKKALWKTKDRLIQPLEDFLGFKIGEYRNYKLVK